MNTRCVFSTPSETYQRVRVSTRPKIVVVIGAAFTTGLSGCLGSEEGRNNDNTESEEDDRESTGESDETEDTQENERAEAPDQPSMRAEPFEPDDPDTTLTIRWNGRVFNAVTFPNEDQYWESADEEQYLILQLAIENTGDNPADFVPGELQITADGTEAEWTVLVDGSRLDVTLDSGESVEDWVAFTIPTDSDEIVITAEPVGDAYTAQFESDETLDIPFVPYE